MEGTEVRLARELHAMYARQEELARQAKTLNAAVEAREQELAEYLAQEGKTSTGNIDGIGVFSLRRENFVSVTQANMPTFLAAVRKAGDGAMIVETIPVQTLKKYARDKIDALTENFIEDESYAQQVANTLGIDALIAPAELAKKCMEVRGVSVYQQVKLSHKKAK